VVTRAQAQRRRHRSRQREGAEVAAIAAARVRDREARHRPLACLRAGQEGLELGLDDAVEHALLRADVPDHDDERASAVTATW
jgi:hypothetical protein